MQEAQNQPPQPQPPSPQHREQVEQALHSRNNSRNPFNTAGREEKHKSLVDSLRKERGVQEPTESSPPQAVEANSSTPAPAPAPTQQEKDVLADYEAKLRATMATEASVEAKRAEAERLEKEAADKLAKIESAKSDPLEFLAQLGITEDDWQKHLAQTADTPEMSRIKAAERKAAEQIQALQKQFESYKQEQEQERAQSRLSQAAQLLQSDDYLLTSQISNPEAVLRRQQEIEQHTGNKVSLADAAKHLEQSFKDNLKQIWENPKIHAMFATKPQSVSTAESYTPTTLNSAFSSGTQPGESTPAPLDWAAKQKLFVEKLRRMRELERL